MYNKEVKKQLTMSLISDELGAGINEEEQRDPEAHSVKKGNQWIGVDADSGYLGAEKKDDAILVNNEEHPIRYQINKRPS